MPYLETSTYKVPSILTNTHVQTIYRAIFRKVKGFKYSERQRLETPDDDFLDVDWAKAGSRKLVIGLHGLAGSSKSTYMTGLMRYANQMGWDGLAMNYRGCSGEINRKLRSYHSGETGDLEFLLTYIHKNFDYEEIALVGFSLGGNVVMKFAGEQSDKISPQISRVVAVSAPVHLESCSQQLDRWYNKVYLKRFLIELKQMAFAKKHLSSGQINYEMVRRANSFREFDDAVTAPAHGFRDAQDYWNRASSLPYLSRIRVPSLLINAWDDTFLGDPCYPIPIARESEYFHLETPTYGGHVGFLTFDRSGNYWTEKRVFEFISGV